MVTVGCASRGLRFCWEFEEGVEGEASLVKGL
jgi:hypothetical protein